TPSGATLVPSSGLRNAHGATVRSPKDGTSGAPDGVFGIRGRHTGRASTRPRGHAMARKQQPPPARKTWQESWEFMKLQGVSLPRGKASPVTGDVPRAGQKKVRGLAVRKRVFEEVDFENLCLNKTLFAGCRFNGVSFRNTDLTLCCLEGCQFVDCDFSDAR